MFGLQPWHIMAIVAVALIVFGPSRLPELGRSLGKTLNEFRDATARTGEEFRKSVDEKPETQSEIVTEKTDA